MMDDLYCCRVIDKSRVFFFFFGYLRIQNLPTTSYVYETQSIV